ncbi:MAG: hypothetical protein Q8K89_09610, partial [Actinomycetota bacterium]|nr:hypothetical protein [Actinomycetota bacterium]
MITPAEELLSLLWVFAFMVLPALPAAWALGRLLEADWVEALASAFAMSLASAGVASIVAWTLGRGLNGAAGIHVALLATADVVLVLMARRKAAKRLALDYWPSAWMLIIGIVAVLERPWLAPNMDAWYHVAAARSLLFSGGSIVTDPFFGLGSRFADPTSGALHVLLGMTARFSGQDVVFLWAGLNVLCAMLLSAALWSLLRQLGAKRRHALSTVLAVAFFASTAEFRFSAYPNQVGIALLLLSLAGLAGAVRGRDHAWILATVAGFAASATHAGAATALVALAGISVMGLVVFAFTTRGAGRGTSVPWPERRVWLAALGMIAGAATAFIPRLWYLTRSNVSDSVSVNSGSTESVRSVFLVFGRKLMFHPQGAFPGGDLMLLLGTTLAVLCLIEGARRKNRLMGLAGVIGLSPVVIGFNPVITPVLLGFSAYASYRLLAITWFAPWVAVAVGWRHNPLIARLAVIGTLLTGLPALHNMFTEEPPVAYRSGVQNVSVAAGWERDFTHMAGRETIADLKAAFGDSWPIVATDELTGYALAGLANVHVWAVPELHSPAAIERSGSGGVRRRAMWALMAPTTSNERRAQLVRDSGADFVLLWPNRVAENARLDLIRDTETFD